MNTNTVWGRLKIAVQDSSFIIGSILVITLVVIAAIGPEITPHNPFVRDQIQWVDGELQSAPFEPSGTYLLGTDSFGRDNLSLLLYGARQTLIMATVGTVVRMLLGLFLGMVAGWQPESLIDRGISAITEFLAAIPGLILAMLLIFAVGIDKGRVSFIIALSVVGIGDITQTIRGYVMKLRASSFIEAAQALGLSPAGILSRHVLPNLLPTILSLLSLQMGNVLLLLGELGFVGIFVGGGAKFFNLIDFTSVSFYIQPDWGAMLGTTWAAFRSRPWLPLVPAVAFFIAIMSFNLFGHGLQRFFERGRFYPSGWSVLKVVLIIAAILFGLNFLLNQSGPEAFYVDLANEFDVTRAWNDLIFLTAEELDGRVSGTQGSMIAAGYIANQFEAAGLTPFPTGTYFQAYDGAVSDTLRPPILQVLGADGSPVLTISDGISFDPYTQISTHYYDETDLVVIGNAYEQLPPGGIVFQLDTAEDAARTRYGTMRYDAVFYIVPDEELFTGDAQPWLRDQVYMVQDEPFLYIGESAAREVLAAAGLDLDELQERHEKGEQIYVRPGTQVRLSITSTSSRSTGYNVVSYLPAAGVANESGQRILVAVPYTTNGSPPGDFYPAADNASSIAVMLEAARILNEVNFQPTKTLVFIAFDQAGDSAFDLRPILPTTSSDSWEVVILDGLGGGSPQLARVESDGGYAAIFDQSARRFHLRTTALDNYPFFFIDGRGLLGGNQDPEYSGIAITRPGSGLTGTPLDTRENITPEYLLEAGKVISHFLMVLSS